MKSNPLHILTGHIGHVPPTEPQPEPLSSHRVPRLPNRKVVIDGTTCQPNYTPPDVSGDDLSRVANRSYESKLSDPNGYGDSTEARHRNPRHNVPADKTASVSFTNGQKKVTYTDGQNEPLKLKEMPGSVLSGPSFAPRKRIVGNSPRNPQASLKAFDGAKAKGAEQGEFTPDEG